MESVFGSPALLAASYVGGAGGGSGGGQASAQHAALEESYKLLLSCSSSAPAVLQALTGTVPKLLGSLEHVYSSLAAADTAEPAG